MENGKFKKTCDVPKTPLQGRLESPGLSAGVKEKLKRRVAAANPITLKRLENQAVDRLLFIHK